MTNNQNTIGKIKLERKIYGNRRNSLYYAYLYCTHNDYVGNINSAIMDAFQLIHSPLGLHKYGPHEETIRQTIQSISILEGHINYLKETIGLTSHHDNPPSLPPAIVTSQNTENTTENTTGNTTQELSKEEELALTLFDNFSLD
ncbi:MAG: hypothetical protein F6K54_05435 [Okeania sp. SIO3B5]|uniref:hypothetical protein n=1 Tax=Okeania sp. SIO3B5 TaxID=2607811 RepID=UPI001400AF1D|nr:hypothetical protein [Okeania sp. SIO3B5]NEO52561.1 hypothetical protein [Okeania sp. SIO3B5]